MTGRRTDIIIVALYWFSRQLRDLNYKFTQLNLPDLFYMDNKNLKGVLF